MKTPCTCPPQIVPTLAKSFAAAISSAALMLTLSASAQVTPLSVPASGVGPIRFDSNPTLATGWSTRSVAGGAGDVTTAAAEDTAVAADTAASIATALATDSNGATPVGTATTSGAFRWNSVRQFLESRPTGVNRAELLLSLRNDSGADRSTVILDYDFGVDVLSNEADNEDVGLFGHRVYWSLTGAANTWTHIPELDTAGAGGAGPKHVQLALPGAWEVGANLYFLWTDDNGVPSTTGNGSGNIEGPYTIDNLSVTFQVTPVSIATQPHDITMETCHGSNITVAAVGTGPITYQWYKGNLSTPVTGATGTTLTFANPQLSDAGTYFVVATGPGAGNSQESTHVTVAVNQDSTQPDVLSAIARLNGTNVIVTFSEPMFAPTTGNPDSYLLHPTSAGSDTIPLSAALNTAGTVLTLAFSEPRDPGAEYELVIDGSVSDACGNPLVGSSFPLQYEIVVMTLTNTTWKYNAEGQDLGIDWYDPNYDTSTWQTGLSLLDGKQETVNFTPTPRASVNGQEVLTTLPLRLSSGTYATSNIPVYYFRSSFTLPVSLSHVKGLRLLPFVDDFDIVYLNGNGTPVHISPGYSQADINFFGYPGGGAVGDANFAGPYDVSAANLVEGANLIAVKLYQQAIGSSDITLGYEILAIVDTLSGVGPGPQLAVSKDPNTGAVTLTWASGSGGVLYEANSVDAAAGAWSAVAGASDGSYSFTPPAVGGTQKFYVLRK